MDGSDCKIRKRILHTGKEVKQFQPGCKVRFHFRTCLCDENGTEIDDSRKLGKPMELVLGKKFRLEVWETVVQAMAVGEIAAFHVDKSLCTYYPFVSKTLRDVSKPDKPPVRSHCCGGSFQSEGTGYEDLNKLVEKPQDLEFTIELLEVAAPNEYSKESWQLTEDEKLKEVPKLQIAGNEKYKNKDYEGAASTYATAIGYLEQLMIKEKPKDEEWNTLNSLKLPLLLNFSQCKLLLGDYYPVIEHCTTVLESEPGNVKALFRRGKAHFAVWNVEEAKKDFERVATLDPSLKQTVQNQLKTINEAIAEKDKEDRKILQGKIF
ncbi:unnamed protein product [Bemisia tabaci]|uniref:peptidylprolyl isomerase n=2 Tax=Bemisia tabaci TaxID=7038 RepID=A0A9P0F6W4_BEMTA|nr:unnamed protein product [Bemisia tabaci]